MLNYAISYHAILCYTVLYYTILYYTILKHTVLFCTVLHCTILVLYWTGLDWTGLDWTVLHYTVLYWYCSVLYHTIPSVEWPPAWNPSWISSWNVKENSNAQSPDVTWARGAGKWPTYGRNRRWLFVGWMHPTQMESWVCIVPMHNNAYDAQSS